MNSIITRTLVLCWNAGVFPYNYLASKLWWWLFGLWIDHWSWNLCNSTSRLLFVCLFVCLFKGLNHRLFQFRCTMVSLCFSFRYHQRYHCLSCTSETTVSQISGPFSIFCCHFLLVALEKLFPYLLCEITLLEDLNSFLFVSPSVSQLQPAKPASEWVNESVNQLFIRSARVSQSVRPSVRPSVSQSVSQLY